MEALVCPEIDNNEYGRIHGIQLYIIYIYNILNIVLNIIYNIIFVIG
jgi:hypothetical protein